MDNFISSKENTKIKEACRAKDGKGDYFLVEGFHLVEMAVQAGAAVRIFSEKPYDTTIENYQVSHEVLMKLASTKSPEGICALCKKSSSKPFSSLRVLYLDQIADPGNLGTLLRTALAFGFYDVLLSYGTAEVYSSKTLLASQGAIFKLNIRQSTMPAVNDVEELKRAGYRLVATDLKASCSPHSLLFKGEKMVLVLGNEAHGVSSSILSLSDYVVRIEMANIDSLNVGVAGGILMYEYRVLP